MPLKQINALVQCSRLHDTILYLFRTIFHATYRLICIWFTNKSGFRISTLFSILSPSFWKYMYVSNLRCMYFYVHSTSFKNLNSYFFFIENYSVRMIFLRFDIFLVFVKFLYKKHISCYNHIKQDRLYIGFIIAVPAFSFLYVVAKKYVIFIMSFKAKTTKNFQKKKDVMRE